MVSVCLLVVTVVGVSASRFLFAFSAIGLFLLLIGVRKNLTLLIVKSYTISYYISITFYVNYVKKDEALKNLVMKPIILFSTCFFVLVIVEYKM